MTRTKLWSQIHAETLQINWMCFANIKPRLQIQNTIYKTIHFLKSNAKQKSTNTKKNDLQVQTMVGYSHQNGLHTRQWRMSTSIKGKKEKM